ncbi:hypothetical protein BDR05DRAFT_951020 [Suillus weaverae]|nr:hypothetical protein BDR05DRAFT_951020 [Suillus weaverae]
MSFTTPPVGPVVTALAATLTVGASLSFSGLDTWSFDNYITPGPQEDLGSGDAIIVFFLPFPRSSPPPVPVVPRHRMARHSRKGRPIGDRVARDSDDLPIWDTQARRTKVWNLLESESESSKLTNTEGSKGEAWEN